MAGVTNVEKGNKFDTNHYKLDPVLCKIEIDNKSGKQKIDFSSVEMKLMEDFLEMERLVIIEELERGKAQLALGNENLDTKQKLFQKNFDKEKRLSEENREKMEKDLKFELEVANLKIVKLQNELSNLEIRINKEKAVSVEVEAKYREMKASIAKINGETKVIQEKELAVTAVKLLDCQKTIASLKEQLKYLANFEELGQETRPLNHANIDDKCDKLIQSSNTT
ncbi:Filament-like plant protein [Rhynchospora pubera]|uniref:Filament-like plant protein n=1 Tax=Rhynchospora pubera TaxID=906938 RepID=A0AAV8D430_9POAL|nr:Filament-like plant protein [Rhynchospora pubera]